ncbi:hypothetical protein RINTHM_6400 [Richelia intracellularis HM01]|uniref:hypothetical protein n=1 Tax=Richelia intracellularis TaxID=1164990 RepID=UPI0002B53E88|nr:hypothetical protein [Richelia intracellularis]CCH65106.1 hypothetical protein RINTHM_6400 [Richelia intracellularis HM01]
MENWQFLIQQQGENYWYPIESATVQLPEGKYRIVASSNCANTDIEARLIRYPHQKSSAKILIRERACRTNNDGLVAVVPFIFMTSGSWELTCCKTLMSDVKGQHWKYIVHLEILPDGIDQNPIIDMMGKDRTSDGLNNHIDKSTITPSVTSKNPVRIKRREILEDINKSRPPKEKANINTSEKYDFQEFSLFASSSTSKENRSLNELVPPIISKAETAEKILQNLTNLALPNDKSTLEKESAQSGQDIIELPLQISLDAETYFVPWGVSFTIQGVVELNNKFTFSRIYRGKLQIELQSPLNLSSEMEHVHGSKILQIKKSITENILPCTFTCELQIPENCTSKLILAELNLFAAVEVDSETKLLASHTFTINTSVIELLALSVAAQSLSNEELLNFSDIVLTKNMQKEARMSTSLDLELFNLAKKLPTDKKLLSSRYQSYSLARKHDQKSLELPFSSKDYPKSGSLSSKISVINNNIVTLPYLRKLSTSLSRNELESLSEVIEDKINQSSLPELISDKTLPRHVELIANSSDTGFLSPLIGHLGNGKEHILSSLIQPQYQDYKPEEIFLDELDIEQGLNANDIILPLESYQDKLSSSQEYNNPSGLNQDRVVDNNTYPAIETLEHFLEPEKSPKQTPAISERMVAAAPLPMPELSVPIGELVAGKLISIGIVLPNLGSHIAVKIWIKDFQTRRLLIKPHILKNWSLQPTEQEITTQIQIPLGYLEIQFEAVTIDLTTQQESYKVIIPRSVIPENLP